MAGTTDETTPLNPGNANSDGTYQTITVDPAAGSLRYQSFDRDNREVDAFGIQKSHQRSRFAAAGPVARAK